MQPALIPLAASDLPLPVIDPGLLEALQQPRLALFWGAHTPTRTLLLAITALAARGREVRVFDGGNRFDGYYVARLARQLSAAPQTILSRIHLSRAFTCFQLAELIENTPATPEPLFALDLLATFYDESVPLRDAERLLAETLAHLKRLAAVGPVVVGAREPQSLVTPRPSAEGLTVGRGVKERWGLLDQLQAAADAAWLLQTPQAEASPQPRLF